MIHLPVIRRVYFGEAKSGENTSEAFMAKSKEEDAGISKGTSSEPNETRYGRSAVETCDFRCKSLLLYHEVSRMILG